MITNSLRLLHTATPGDYIVLCLVVYCFISVLLDIKFNISSKIKHIMNIKLRPEDILFIHLFVASAMVMIFNGKLRIFLIGIVDYADPMLTLFRADLISNLILSYTLAGLLVSVFFATKANNNCIRWCFYGLFFSILALLYYLKARKGPNDA